MITTQTLTTLPTLAFSVVLLSAQSTPAADLSPFAGIWKEDASKTVRPVPDQIRKYEGNADGSMSVTVGTGSTAYHDTFRVDGQPHLLKEYPEQTETWTHPNPSTWETTTTPQASSPIMVRRTVSSDGAALTYEMIYKGNGGNVIYTTIYHRISAEKDGLIGEWKPVSAMVTPELQKWEVTADGTLSVSDLLYTYKLKPDGKPCLVTGSPMKVSLNLPTERTLELTYYMDTKPIEIDTFTLSPDGQTLDEIDRDANTHKQTMSTVYKKQS